jgi:thiol:disulfide interchange protein/DsbC/DsbD-like thiol-disulfide interchange protein
MTCRALIHNMGRYLTLLACLAAASAWAAPLVKTEHVEAELVSDKASAQPGVASLIGLKLRMTPEWHTYWKNPGDSGLPTRIKWTLPEGWKVGELHWPFPQTLPVGPLMNYGYEDEVVLLAELTPPADAKPGNAEIKAHAEWLVCKDVCIPEKGELDFTLPVANEAAKDNPRWQAHIERAKNMWPVQAQGWKYESAIAGKSLVVRLTPPAGATPPAKIFFFPEQELLIEPAAPEKVTRDGNAVRIEMKLADPPLKDVKTLAGVAVSENGWPGIARKAIQVETAVGSSLPAMAGSTGGAVAADGLDGSLWAALAFAFMGGVLLNLMPCVFPVLGIKVMGFVEHAHGDARAMRMQGVMFFVGAVVSFLALAGLMLALRASGAQLGWGFQLQSPIVVMLLAVLFFVLALNLVGVFEWGAFAQSITSNLSVRGRYADALLSGVLATVVATPCTAPFMGAAVGFTLTQSAPAALSIFAVLGIGMATPILLLSLYPALLRKLPRPGAWMETFKQILAFPLFATVAWLTWVLGAQAGNDSVLALLGGLVVIALAAWMYNRWSHSEGMWRPALAMVLGAAGIALAWPTPYAADAATTATQEGDIQWQAWSPEKVRDLNAQGKAVFVDFTAAWCVTCQVNKRVALHNAEVMREFNSRNVVALRADWTRQDPRITETLSSLGRNAVPVYALYVPGEAQPHLLPEVLTPAIVLAELSRLPAGKTAITQR